MFQRSISTDLYTIFLLAALSLAGCKVSGKLSHKTVSDDEELRKLVIIDQQMRLNDTRDMEPIDKKHRAVVMNKLANGGIRTNQDKFHASLILQHTAALFCDGKLMSISPENYLLAYELAKSAFEGGDTRLGSMVAATYDRYLLYTEGYQKYGTQRVFDDVTGEEMWAPIDPATSDEERKKYHIPPLKELLEKYKMRSFPSSK